MSESHTAPTNSDDETLSGTTEVAHFGPGNRNAVSHGATSARVVDPLAEQIAAELVAVHPHLGEPQNAEALRQYSRITAQLELIDMFIAENGLITEGGKVRPVAHLQAKLEPTRLRWLSELGLTPSSAARLARDVSAKNRDVVDIARVIQQMQMKEQAAHGDSL